MNQQNKQRNQNLENNIPVYCFDDLPAWRFFKILESDNTDLRYLCKSKKLPEEQYSFLDAIWDKITEEFDRINGDAVFKNSSADRLSDVEEANEIMILKSCLELMLLADDRAIDILRNQFGIIISGISYETIKKVNSILTRKKTRYDIMMMESYTGAGDKAGNTFLRSLVQMSNILKIQLNRNILTIGEWVLYNQECKQIMKATKHGWSNKVK